MPRWENGFQTSERIQRHKRYAVIREAARIMSRRGFHNTSLDEVAKTLGISKGTLYNYVNDKEEILFECHNIGLELGERAAKFATDNARLAIDQLRLQLKCFIVWMYGQADVGGLTFDVNALRGDNRAAVIAKRDAATAQLAGLIERGIAEGNIRPCDARVAVYGILSAINGVSTWFSPGGRLTIGEVADEMLSLLTLSLATQPRRLTPIPPVPDYPEFEAAFLPYGRGAAPADGRSAPTARLDGPAAREAGARRKRGGATRKSGPGRAGA